MKTTKTGGRPVRLAIIGCGAVTVNCHLPAARNLPQLEIAALVDRDLPRVKSLAQDYGIQTCLDDYHNLPEGIDGVIVALPNYLHAPVTQEFLERGLPVLVEKPMTLSAAEAETLFQTAGKKQVGLQVGLMYRFSQGAQFVKSILDQEWMGPLVGFNFEWGVVYDWPLQTGSAFDKKLAGGGQLLDMGSHVLDLLTWWLGDVKLLEYFDDSLGGVESDCLLKLRKDTANGAVTGTVTLSRLRNLGAGARVVGSKFTAEYDMMTPDLVRVWPTGSDPQRFCFSPTSTLVKRQSWDELYTAQLSAFAQLVSGQAEAVIPRQEALATVALIEECYRIREPLQLPWEKEALQ